MMRLVTLIATGLVLLAGANLATAQDNPFAPRLIVNDRVITGYEVTQRRLFLQLLRSPGNLEERALEALIEDRLRMTAAKRAGIAVTPAQVQEGMTEFAGRANLDTEQFLAAIAQDGVDAQTFRDFVEAGLVWRDLVRAKFGPQSRITEVEVDRAIAAAGRNTAVQVLISELIIPAPPGQEDSAMALARRLQSEISTEAGFAAAARNHSASASAGRGGRIDWIPLANLPPAIASFVLALGPGEVSDPVQIPNAVALFQLRGVQELDTPEPASVSVEYAQLLLPNDTAADAEMARIGASVDSCNDLYGVAPDLPAEQLLRETRPLAEVPQDIALELARLDPGESSTALTRGGARVFLMLCARAPQLAEPLSRDAVRSQLVNQRLAGFADGYLAKLRAEAIIVEP